MSDAFLLLLVCGGGIAVGWTLHDLRRRADARYLRRRGGAEVMCRPDYEIHFWSDGNKKPDRPCNCGARRWQA